MATPRLRIGHGRRRITPSVGGYMAGYAARQEPSQGVHDDLYANVVVLSDGVTRAAIVALDAIGMDPEDAATLRRLVGEAAGAAPEAVLANYSHTHAGPVLYRRQPERFDEGYFQQLLTLCAEAAADAASELGPASLWVGAAPVDIGANRRERRADGEIILGVNPDGQTLREATVWRLAREDADDVVLFSIPIHGTTMGQENLLLSAEWMGAAVIGIEAAHPGLRATFLQGCAGDQNPYRAPRSFELVAAHGRTAAGAVSRALEGMRAVEGAPLASVARVVPVPLEGGGTGRCPIHGLRVGDGVVVGLGGEAFVEYALYTRARSTAQSTLALGYTDGSVGYLPTGAAYAEGGYEVNANRIYRVGSAWDPAALEGTLKRAIHGVLAELGALRG